MSRTLIFTLLLIVFRLQAHSQEMLGLISGNHAGANGLMINPASMINAKAYASLNIISSGVSFNNNYLFLAQGEYTFGDLFKKEYQTVDYGMDWYKLTIYDQYTESDKWVHLNSRTLGPSLMYSYQRHGFAVSTSARAVFAAHDVPYHVAKFAYEGVDYVPQQNIDYHGDNFYISHMSWSEIGFSYAYQAIKKGKINLSLGVTAKRLLGFSGLYLIARSVDYQVPNDSILDVHDFDGDIGLATPVSKNSWNIDPPPGFWLGRGWGWDFGLVLQKNTTVTSKSKVTTGRKSTLCGQTFEVYDYKLGISLVDVGKIHFTQNSEYFVFDHVPTYWVNINKMKYESINHFSHDLSYRFYSDSLGARRATAFDMYLPTAVSAQFDYNLGYNFYLNSFFLYAFNQKLPSLYRPAQLGVIPRYEGRFWGVQLPISLYNLEQPRLGVCLRLLFLTIGSDWIGSFTGRRDFTGTDAYFSINIPFNKGYCKKKSKGRPCRNAEFQKHL